ncbi:nucleotidyltransferase family protein [bacterium]|nr:nucleotidyltransferase family protein [bacterium]
MRRVLKEAGEELYLPEEELAVLSARIDLNCADEDRMGAILCRDVDWSAVDDYSQRLGVKTLMYRHLSRERFAGYIPREVMLSLKEEYQRQSIRNIRIYGQICQILESMNKIKIPLVLLKGAFLAKWIYGDIALRNLSDIDILCREQDADIVQDKLSELGYKRQEEIFHSDFHERVFINNFNHLTPLLRDRSAKVELHIDILNKIPHEKRDMEKVWDAVISCTFDGLQAYRLSVEYQILYLANHLYNHMTKGNITLYWFCDIHEMINRCKGEIDWGQFSRLLDYFAIGSRIRYVFDLLMSGWNTPIPEKVLEGSGMVEYRSGLKEVIRNHLAPDKRNILFLPDYIAKFKTVKRIKGWRNRIYFLWRLVFPSRANLIHRYHINHPFTVCLFYLIHPFILFKRAVKSAFVNANVFKPF